MARKQLGSRARLAKRARLAAEALIAAAEAVKPAANASNPAAEAVQPAVEAEASNSDASIAIAHASEAKNNASATVSQSIDTIAKLLKGETDSESQVAKVVERLQVRIRLLERREMALRKNTRRVHHLINRRTIEAWRVLETVNDTVQDMRQRIEGLEAAVGDLKRVINDHFFQPPRNDVYYDEADVTPDEQDQIM